VTDSFRGNKIVLREWGWIYDDDGSNVDDDPWRECGFCGLGVTEQGHDACLGTLPHVDNACCGHGEGRDSWVSVRSPFFTGILRKEAALRWFRIFGVGPIGKRGESMGKPDGDEIERRTVEGSWCSWCDEPIEPGQPAIPANPSWPGDKERLHLHCDCEEQDGIDLERSFEDW